METLKEREVKDISVFNRSINANVNANNKEAYLFLAVPYSSGWSAVVNGEKVDVLRTDKAFISVPLEKGGNEVELQYIIPGFKLGGAISFLGLVLLFSCL